MIRTLRTMLFLVMLLSSALAFGQSGTATPSQAVLLTVDGEVTTPLKVTTADLAKFPRRSVRAKGHDGKEASFDGVEVGDVLKLAGVKLGAVAREGTPAVSDCGCSRQLPRRLCATRIGPRLHR
jgi:hypothetical protein